MYVKAKEATPGGKRVDCTLIIRGADSLNKVKFSRENFGESSRVDVRNFYARTGDSMDYFISLPVLRKIEETYSNCARRRQTQSVYSPQLRYIAQRCTILPKERFSFLSISIDKIQLSRKYIRNVQAVAFSFNTDR